jgi:hypothetical protein
MRRFTAMPIWMGALVTAGAAALSTGCHETGDACFWPTDKCADIPCGAIPRPAGVYSCQWQTEQKLRAEQDKYVIYQCEWYLGGDHLGPDGRRHIDAIAKKLDGVPYSVLIEKSDNVTLNETRRKYIIATLTSLGVRDAEKRVVLDYSEAEGFEGTEAVRLGNRAPAGPASGPAGGGFGPTSSGFGAGTSVGGGLGGIGSTGGGIGIY